jgi:hypothetical protein
MFTQGKWYTKHKNGVWYVESIEKLEPIGSRYYHVARVSDSKEAESNAALIAASPELLEACKESWELLQEVAAMNIQPFPIRAVALNNQLREVIAKAESI